MRPIESEKPAVTLCDFFAGQDESLCIFEALRSEVDALGPSEIHVTKSQVAFRRRRAFA